mmetsp:Transcript_75423/g.208101  ORF Transcript_75423/g.208101 Transcript_75423/m.208101 type:complete len:221 (+) Transcript_75423:1375-2037(+)
MLGGNWQWSPTRTKRSAPRRTIGTTAESSVACATSSMRMAWNFKRWRNSLPAAIVVVQITSASRKMAILASNSSTRLCLASAVSPLLAAPLPEPLAAPLAGAAAPPLPVSSSSSSAWAFCSCRCLRIDSSVMSSRCEVTFSGRPTRTAFSPRACRPSAMLSTAMLLSDVASSGRIRRSLAHRPRRRTETVVLPVPGGPCTSVRRRPSAAETAAPCEGLRS